MTSLRGDDYLGKIMILTFNDNEEDMFRHIMPFVSVGARAFTTTDLPKGVLNLSALHIDKIRRIVSKNSVEIELTFTEFEILLLLAQNVGIVFSKEQIYDTVWKEPYFGDYNIVMSHIRNIREKIEDNPSKPVYIQTIWGIGYRFNRNLSSGL